MLKHHMAACLAASALIAGPALAQTSTTAPATNTAPVTTPANPTGSTMGANQNANMGTSGFITQREPGMYRASELIGTDVRGANNEDIGEIGDVLLDQNGQARAVVVDIGGFLGIGETHVAIPMQSVQFGNSQMNANATGSVGGTSGAAGTATTGSTATTGASGQTTAQTGANQAGAGANAAMPDVVVVMMSKDQLENAPRFQDDNRGAGVGGTTGGATGGATGTGTTAPRQ